MAMYRRDIIYGLNKNVEEMPKFYAWTEWMWYPEYAVRADQGRRYVEAVKEWLPGRGVLGIPRPDLDSEVWGSSQDVLWAFIGGHGEGVRLNRGTHNDGRGGIEETVERFAVEAWK